MPSAPDDDPIAEALLSDDAEARARYAGWTILGRYRLETKFHALATVSGLPVAVLVGLTTVWRRDLRAALGADPLTTSIAASVVLAAGLKFLTLGTGGLMLSGLLRLRSTNSIDPERLLAFEGAAALLGLGTGGLGTTIGVSLLLLIVTADPTSAGPWFARVTAPVAVPVTYQVILWWAVLLTAVCLVASILFDRG